MSTVSETKKACSDVSRFILSRILTSDPNLTALNDIYCLFTTIVYLAIQVACFGAIFDCFTEYDWMFVLYAHYQVNAK